MGVSISRAHFVRARPALKPRGYDDKRTDPMPPNSVLVFKVELLAVLPAGMAAAR